MKILKKYKYTHLQKINYKIEKDNHIYIFVALNKKVYNALYEDFKYRTLLAKKINQNNISKILYIYDNKKINFFGYYKEYCEDDTLQIFLKKK